MENQQQQQVQHLEINIPEWLANSNDQIVIICNEEGENGDEDGVVTVPINELLDEGGESQVVVQMPADRSQPIPRALYTTQEQVEVQMPVKSPMSQDVPQLVTPEQNSRTVTMSGDAPTPDGDVGTVDENNKIQVFIREHVESVSSDGVTGEKPGGVVEISEGDSGVGSKVENNSVSKSNLNEHDYLAAKQPAQVSRRSKRKAAAFPQRKRCHTGCCDGDEEQDETQGTKAKSSRINKDHTPGNLTVDEETVETPATNEKLASDNVTCDGETAVQDTPAAKVGTRMALRKKKGQSGSESMEEEKMTTDDKETENKPEEVDKPADDAVGDSEKATKPGKKKATKGTKKVAIKREQDTFTITPDGIEAIDPDEVVPINIIKASKPKDVTAFSADLAVTVNIKFECVCGQTFTQKKSLIRHFRRKQSRADGVEEEGSQHYSKYPIAIYPNTKAPRLKPAEKSFTCPHCPKVLQSKGGMDYHIMCHTGIKPILCSLCGETFKSKQTLDQHFVIHSQTNELPHKCDECGRTYLTATRLRAHKKIHGEKKFHCELCSHSFVMSKDLRKHMRVHTGVKPFKCDFCDERFHFSQDVKRHLKRLHIDKAPYICRECPKQTVCFFKEEEYKSHMKLHSNDTEFRCDVCLQNFPTYTTLRNHQMLHGDKNPFKCRYETCGQIFKCANDRYVHERKVHDTNLLYCQFCRMSFKKPSAFEEHQQKHVNATFECRVDPECVMKFQQPHIRLRHEKSHSKPAGPASSSTGHQSSWKRGLKKKPIPKETISSPATIYQCGICWKTYKNYPSLRDHVREHGDEMPYECRVVGCGERFKRVYHRRKHEQSHSTDDIINSVIDSRLRANEDSIDSDEGETSGENQETVTLEQAPTEAGPEQTPTEVAPEQIPVQVAAEDASTTNADSLEIDETEIAVQFVLT
ncbi:uncharacterized protein [Amphiura filiformis]|uniref:uncharacterized protein n=1 Tax=Amphiura filiformis TaxID=82378 RepID=UPI003B214FDE